jgi:HPt (histidine-containing phosphotransfer) domain-containing protein
VRVIRQRLADMDTLAVVALSADPGWIDRSVLTAAGFNGYVIKPATMADLHIGITKVLERLPEAAPPPVAQESEEQVSLETATLRQLADDLGDPALVRETLTVYLEELPGRLVALHQAQGSGSADEVRSVAHSLKGASGMLGAMRLSGLCARMETQADDATLIELTAEAEQVETLMRSYLAEESLTG